MNIGYNTQQNRVEDNEVLRRSGILGWWLNLTAPPRPRRVLSIAERERLRKADLTSISILAIFCFIIALVSNSLASLATAEAVSVMAVGLFIAAILNRFGKTLIAAYLIPSLMMLVIAAAIVGSKGGVDLILIPAYDLFVLPIFLVSLIGNRNACWLFAFIAIAFIVFGFTFLPHALITAPGATNFDSVKYEISLVTWWGTVNRHIALAFFAALFGWLGARSVEGAIRRADRAEELAALEHAYAVQRQQLELGAQQLLETHVRVANGDFSARAPLAQDNLLWQVAASLNNLLNRLQKTADAGYQLQRTNDEIARVAAALDDLQAGRRPIWPAPTNTAADLILERVAGRTRQHAGPPPMRGGNTPVSSFGQQGASYAPRTPGAGAGSFAPTSGRQYSVPPTAGREQRRSMVPGSSPYAPTDGNPMSPMYGSNPLPNRYNGSGDLSSGGLMGQAPMGQMPSMPPTPTASQMATSGPLQETDWPALDQFGTNAATGRFSGYQQGSDASSPADNPWYLPPEE